MNNDVVALKDYAVVIRRRWRIVLITVMAMLVAVGAYAMVWPPVYEGVAEVQVRTLSERAAPLPEGVRENDIETQKYVANSEPVSKLVIEDIGLDVEPDELGSEWVSTEVIPDTQLLRISVRAGSPELAARVANAFVEHYLEYRRRQLADEMSVALKEVQDREAEIRDRLAAIERQSASASKAEKSALERERRSLEDLLGTVAAQAATRATMATPTVGSVVQEAQADPTPIAPRPLRDGSLALVLGLLVGGGLAFARDHFDETVQDVAGLRRLVPAGTVLGGIPHLRRGQSREEFRAALDPGSPQAGAYQSLAAQVRGALARSGRGNRLLVSSGARQEGRSSAAAHLAVAHARVGRRVLLIDADLRQPDLSARFGLAGRPGLSEILAKDAAAEETVADAGVENLWILPAGGTPRPARLSDA